MEMDACAVTVHALVATRISALVCEHWAVQEVAEREGFAASEKDEVVA